ncbi:hypothetical protein ABID59_001427 [Bradyrhizobium sp. S3.3.6]|uniref:hypothetical protein n=1 Tax=Bradyrhizobium sp. S3.3.6 TaxID=3156429 RepID=UPI00339B0F5A
MLRFMAAIIALLCGSAANAAECKSIPDAAARLACYDAAPKTTPKASTAKKPPADEFADAKAALIRKLKDPESARFTDLFKVSTTGEGDVVCGMVNSKNSMGGYAGARGFIFQRRQNLATMMLSGASDPDYRGENAAAYCVHCTPDARADRDFSSYCPSLIKSYRSGR